MIKRTELLRFRNKVYTRVKAVLLTDDLVKELSYQDLVRLKSIFTYDFYDNIKRLTSEVTLLNDNKRLKETNCLEFSKVLDIQLRNIIFLTKKIVILNTKRGREISKQKEKQKDLVYGEFD